MIVITNNARKLEQHYKAVNYSEFSYIFTYKFFKYIKNILNIYEWNTFFYECLAFR